MITDVVTNGCSYMATYAQGKGHNDLALALQMQSDEYHWQCQQQNY
mgnify:CR=1 FL=1